MRLVTWTGTTLVAALAVIGTAACDTREGVYEDTETATEQAGSEVAEEGREAGDAIGDATSGAMSATDAAAQTAQIKSKLAADDTLEANDINVDTNGDTRTVTLKGEVETETQRAAAERIAKETAPEYRVVNLLTVKG